MREHYPEVAVDLRGVHPTYLTRVVSQWNELAYRYPDVAREISYFGTYVEKRKMPEALREAATGFNGEFAHAWYVQQPNRPRQQIIALNPAWFSAPVRFEEALKAGVKETRTLTGKVIPAFHPPGCDTVEHVITHEFGHHVHYWYLRNVDPTDAWTDVVAPSGWGLVKDSFNMWWSAWAESASRRAVSRYAASSASEGFAEAFAALHHAPVGWKNEYADSLQEMLAIMGPDARRYARPQYRWLDELPSAGDARRRAWSRLQGAAKRMGVSI